MKKVTQILFSAVLLLAIFGISLASIFGERAEISYYENRTLAHFPRPTWESFWDGSFFTDIDSAVDDHISGRDFFMKTATKLDILLDRPNVNDIVITADGGPLLNFYAYDTQEEAEDFIVKATRLGTLAEEISAYGGYLLYVGIPVQDAYFTNAYPNYMNNHQSLTEERFAEFPPLLEEQHVSFLNMKEIFEAEIEGGQLYFLTDHHYNFNGALLTYRSILERVNLDTGRTLTILQDEDLVFHTLENPVLGSRNRKLYGLGEAQDSVVYATLREEIAFEREDAYYDAQGSMFQLPETAEEYAGYTVYMGGDLSETIIRTNREELPNCLIFGDSFTNAVETVLWTAFNETRSLDLRHYTAKTLKEYIAEYQPDVVICIQDENSFYNLEGNGYYGD